MLSSQMEHPSRGCNGGGTMNIEMKPTEAIKPYDNNPRRISPEAIDKVAASINEFGFRQPIVVDKDYVVIVGHTRLQAAIKLGLKQVPVNVVDNLTPEQIKAYRIADNKTNEYSEWDDSLLRQELQELQKLNVDISLTAFSSDDLLKALKLPETDTEGSTEINPDDFDLKHKCPRCGFQYNKDKK